ncbi:PQQ-binding-like beta-propeller repeat protein [Dictyobacter formicarum]|uniref:Pyrrolo-quinoline quinone repeat domain-containing protein n=1 Tax=Dictyobacter formicarum TaxID=2778368 RepID=A0ABQ3VGN1_9CHLR|nr:PQQ-binding-like beta-propeller repeat protein [Dictyobacter formicarum]GHO84874.1 hypothetical protein KSZ_28800 [Dictyobacter formicarum]
MDYRPDQKQHDQSDIEFEITDIDTEEAGHQSARPSRFEPMFTSLANHAHHWSVLAIFAGCVIIGVLLFPDVASFVKPMVPAPATTIPTVKPDQKPDQFAVAAGRDNVTFVMREQTDAQSIPRANINVTAYDTQSGTLLWHTPQSPSPAITYGLAVNLDSQESDIYALHSDNLISLLAPRTGKVLQNYKLPTAKIKPFAIEQDDMLLFPDSDNTFYAAKDGQPLWLNAGLGSLLAIEQGVVYTYNFTQHCYYAIDERSGARLWSYVVPHSIQSYSQTVPPLAIENKTVYVQTIDNKVLAIQLQGHVLWSHTFNGPVSLKSDTHHLYAVDQSANTIEAFNLQTGNIERTYTNEAGAVSIKDIQNNMLYIQTDEGMRAVNADTGKIVWQKAINVSQPVWEANGILYVFLLNSTDAMQAINEKDGTLLWSGIIKDLIVSRDTRVLDLLSYDNRTISVLRLSDGKILWSKHTGQAIGTIKERT